MRKAFFIILAIIVVFSSCGGEKLVSTQGKSFSVATLGSYAAEDILSFDQIVIFDGCEYLFYRLVDGYFGYTHKGNCNNPIHGMGR